MSIVKQMQTKITGYHVGVRWSGQKFLNVNQKSIHARNANNVGNFLVSQFNKGDTSKYC